jgi:hypothetical protein
MKQKLKYIKHFESLNMSSDVRDFVYDKDNSNDKVSKLLQALADSDLYDNDEDVNFISLAEDINKLSFRPLKRRKGVDYSQMYEPNIMPTRVGRLIKKIFNTAKPYFQYNGEHEIHFENNKIEIKKELDVINIQPYGDKILGNQKIKINVYSSIDSRGEEKLDKPEVYEDVFHSYSWDWEYDNKTTWFTGDPENIYRKLYLNIRKDLYLENGKNYFAQIEVTSDIDINDADIEKFVNKFVAYQRENRVSETVVLKEATGEEIRKYYLVDNYKKVKGTLGNSCMRHSECQDYLDIYCENEEVVSLIVLLDDDKVVARALLWKLDNGKKLLDRCYSIMDYDQVRYENLAKKNGWFYYKSGDVYYDNAKVYTTLRVYLKNYDFRSYPYVDTLKILDDYNGTLSNELLGDREDAKLLSDTEGGWEKYYSDDDDY